MSSFRQRLGPALAAEGVITVEQLKEAQELEKRHPHLTLAQIISIMYRVPAETIDAVNLREVVMPGFESVLRKRLAAIAATDRFARHFDVEAYAAQISTEPVTIESRSVQVRAYSYVEGRLAPSKAHGFLNTQAVVLVTVTTSSGDTVQGEVTVRHDTQTRALTIAENDGDVKNALYYSLRESFKKSMG